MFACRGCPLTVFTCSTAQMALHAEPARAPASGAMSSTRFDSDAKPCNRHKQQTQSSDDQL